MTVFFTFFTPFVTPLVIPVVADLVTPTNYFVFDKYDCQVKML